MKTWCLIVALLVLLSGLVTSQTEGENTTTIAPEVTTEQPTKITTEQAGTVPPPEFTTVCDAVNYVTSAVTGANTCSATAACNGLNCNLAILQSDVADYAVSIAFLPCLGTPSFRITIRDVLGEIFNGIVSETQTVAQEELFDQELILEVDQREDSVGFQIRTIMLDFETGLPINVVLVPNVYYPVNSCSDQTLCNVITKLASGQNSQGSCSVTPRCDGILCTLAPLEDDPSLIVDLTAKIVQCNEPTAVQLIITDPVDGTDLANEVLTNSSSVVNVFGNGILVTLDQFSAESAVGVQVQVEVPGDFESTVMSVLDYTYFPVTREGQMCSLYSPTCLAFQGVVDKASRSNVTCQTTDKCDGVRCFLDVLDNGALFESTSTLSCFNSKPSLDLVLREPIFEGQPGDILLNRTAHEAITNINILGYDIVINLDLTDQSAIGFSVMLLRTEEGEEPVTMETPVIQFTQIPLDANLCSGCAFVTTSLLVMLISTLLSILGTR